MRSNSVKTSSIAYLRGMVKRALAGNLSPNWVWVLRLPEETQRRAVARAQRDAEERRLAVERASPEYQRKVAEHRPRFARCSTRSNTACRA
jgi:hypothetical protein